MLEFYSRLVGVTLITLMLVVFASTELSAQTLYKGRWIAESFGNDIVTGTGTAEENRFSVYAVPHGQICNGLQPLCDFDETPVALTKPPGPETAYVFNPIGTVCKPISDFAASVRPEPGGTVRGPDGTPIPPLFRTQAHFTSLGNPLRTQCNGFDNSIKTTANPTTMGGWGGAYEVALQYVPPFDPLRGKLQAGAPVSGGGSLVQTASGDFNFPAASATPPGNQGGWGPGMFRTTRGSWPNVPPYLYSYTYATLRNDAGDFGRGKGFFATVATKTKLTFTNTGAGNQVVATVTVTKGSNSFGGVMELLGSFTNKVCYFNNARGGCGLGSNDFHYESIGRSGFKNPGSTTTSNGIVLGPYSPQSSVVTRERTFTETFKYFQTALNQFSTYYIVAQRFPWTTGTVTVNATGRGPHDTYHRREGFDNRIAGIGTVQLVSPILTQWLGPTPATELETGGVAILQLEFLAVPEPSVLLGMLSGLSLLAVLYRRKR
jgi:hypothetical protein